MSVWRDEFMMCVRAGRSVGEIAWSRCDGIKRAGGRMTGEEKLRYFYLG